MSGGDSASGLIRPSSPTPIRDLGEQANALDPSGICSNTKPEVYGSPIKLGMTWAGVGVHSD